MSGCADAVWHVKGLGSVPEHSCRERFCSRQGYFLQTLCAYLISQLKYRIFLLQFSTLTFVGSIKCCRKKYDPSIQLQGQDFCIDLWGSWVCLPCSWVGTHVPWRLASYPPGSGRVLRAEHSSPALLASHLTPPKPENQRAVVKHWYHPSPP